MSSKLPLFPIFEPQHFSDYGFDPQIDYFQVLEEARKHKRETTRSIDTLHFKLQKPISKDDQKKKKRRWWWKNAVVFFKTKWTAQHQHHHRSSNPLEYHNHNYNCRSISGPIYVTESNLSGSTTTPCRSSTRSTTSGPLTRKGDLDNIPYINLKDLNDMEMEEEQHPHVISSPTPMPIYLVT